MLWRIVGLFVRSRWRTFCGMSPAAFVEVATTALDELGYEYSTRELSTTSTERVMLGSDTEGELIEVDDPISFDIQVIKATGNPVTRATLGFFVSQARKEELYSGLSVVTFSGFSPDTRPAIGEFVRVLTEHCEKPPWNVDHHYHFRLAFLLRYKIGILWKYWLRVASEQRST